MSAARVVRCKLCLGQRVRPVYRHESGWPLWRCRDCGLLFFELPNAAQVDYWATGGSTHNLEVYEHPSVLREQVARFDGYLGWLEAHRSVGTLLDYGCGVGTFMERARGRGWKVYGVDRSAKALDRARGRGLRVRQVEEPQVSGGSFPVERVDVVTLWDALEHLQDPHAGLRWIASRLKPGGVLLIETPDADYFLRRWSLRLARWSRGLLDGARFFFYPDHQLYLTQRHLVRLLRQHGFQVRWVRRTTTSRAKVVHKLRAVHRARAWKVWAAWGVLSAGAVLGGNKLVLWATKAEQGG